MPYHMSYHMPYHIISYHIIHLFTLLLNYMIMLVIGENNHSTVQYFSRCARYGFKPQPESLQNVAVITLGFQSSSCKSQAQTI